MKTKIYLLVFTLTLSFAAFNHAKAAVVVNNHLSFSKDEISKMTIGQKQARLQEIKDRVSEIRSMDKSTLTHEDKKELRAELKSMRKETREMQAGSSGGGIYLSVGAIIIIILLLILVLK